MTRMADHDAWHSAGYRCTLSAAHEGPHLFAATAMPKPLLGECTALPPADPLDTPAPAAAPLSEKQVARIRAESQRYIDAGSIAHANCDSVALCDSHEALRTALSEARAERDEARKDAEAWTEWASHQEWCAQCAEASPDECTKDGGALKKAAHARDMSRIAGTQGER